MNSLDLIEREAHRKDLPPFRSGDTVRVHVRSARATRSGSRCSRAS